MIRAKRATAGKHPRFDQVNPHAFALFAVSLSQCGNPMRNAFGALALLLACHGGMHVAICAYDLNRG